MQMYANDNFYDGNNNDHSVCSVNNNNNNNKNNNVNDNNTSSKNTRKRLVHVRAKIKTMELLSVLHEIVQCHLMWTAVYLLQPQQDDFVTCSSRLTLQ